MCVLGVRRQHTRQCSDVDLFELHNNAITLCETLMFSHRLIKCEANPHTNQLQCMCHLQETCHVQGCYLFSIHFATIAFNFTTCNKGQRPFSERLLDRPLGFNSREYTAGKAYR